MKNFYRLADVAVIGDKVAYFIGDNNKIVSKIIRTDTEKNTIETAIDEDIKPNQLYDRRYTMQITEVFEKNPKRLQTRIKLLPDVETSGKDNDGCWILAPQFNLPSTLQQLQM